jgi:amidase
VITNFKGANPEVDAVFKAAQDTLGARGAHVVSIELPKAFETLWSDGLEKSGAKRLAWHEPGARGRTGNSRE